MYPYKFRVDWANDLKKELIDDQANFHYGKYAEIYALFNILGIEKMNDAGSYERRAEQYSCGALAMRREAVSSEKNIKKFACISTLARFDPNPSDLARLDFYRDALELLEETHAIMKASQNSWQTACRTLGIGRKVESEFASLIKGYRHKIAELEFQQAQIWLPPTWTYKILRFLGFSHEWLTDQNEESTESLRARSAILQLAGAERLKSDAVKPCDFTMSFSQTSDAMRDLIETHQLKNSYAKQIQSTIAPLQRAFALQRSIDNLRSLDKYPDLSTSRSMRIDEICYQIQNGLAQLSEGDSYLIPGGLFSTEGSASTLIEITKTGEEYSIRLHTQCPEIISRLTHLLPKEERFLDRFRSNTQPKQNASRVFELNNISAETLLTHRVRLDEDEHLTSRFIRELLEPSLTQAGDMSESADSFLKVFVEHKSHLRECEREENNIKGNSEHNNVMSWLSDKIDPTLFQMHLLDSNVKARKTLTDLAQTKEGEAVLAEILTTLSPEQSASTHEKSEQGQDKSESSAAPHQNELQAVKRLVKKGAAQYQKLKLKLNHRKNDHAAQLARLNAKRNNYLLRKAQLESSARQDHMTSLLSQRSYTRAAYLTQLHDGDAAALEMPLTAPSWFADSKTQKSYESYLQAAKHYSEAEQLDQSCQDDSTFLMKAHVAASGALVEVLSKLAVLNGDIENVEHFIDQSSPAPAA